MLLPDQAADVQGFNKVYLYLCKQIDEAILNAGYSLTEKDVLLEISKTERCTANILTHRLHIDRSYMSRMIARLEKEELIEKTLSKRDSRVRYIRLTEKGRKERHLSEVFSAYVDNIVYEFGDKFNPKTDCLNILECNGVPAGSIAVAREHGYAPDCRSVSGDSV